MYTFTLSQCLRGIFNNLLIIHILLVCQESSLTYFLREGFKKAGLIK